MVNANTVKVKKMVKSFVPIIAITNIMPKLVTNVEKNVSVVIKARPPVMLRLIIAIRKIKLEFAVPNAIKPN